MSISTPISRRRQVISTALVSIAFTYIPESLAFRTATAPLLVHHRPNRIHINIPHHHHRRHPTSSHQHSGHYLFNNISHREKIWKANNALRSSDEGYDDWCIDEENDGDNNLISPVTETSSKQKLQQLDDDEGNDSTSNDIRTYFATCIPGLQNTLASELTALGATHVETQGKSGVRFEGSPKVGFKSILWCRTAHRIMELIASSSDPPPSSMGDNDFGNFDYQNDVDFTRGIRNRDDLYQFTKSAVHTPTLLGDGRGGLLTLSVSTIYASKAPNKELCHGHFTALTVKNALVDAVRDLREDGDRPNVDVEDSDVPLVIVLRGRRVNDSGGRGGDWRDNRKGGRNYDETSYREEESVADADLYRVLHSGGSLHRRGYRQGVDVDTNWEGKDGADYGEEEDDWTSNNARNNQRSQNANIQAPIHRAAMKESLAAGLLLEAGWDKLVNAARGDGLGAVLVDPMTGSGTLPTEAALIACDMAPGLLRIASWRDDGGGGRRNNPHRCPPCVRWKDFSDVGTWDELVAKAMQRAKSGMEWARSSSESARNNVKILCNEKNPRAVGLAKTSIRNAGVNAIVSLGEGDCSDWHLGGEDSADDRDILEGRTIFVCNPPWGLRLTEDIDESWVSLREFLRREAGGCESWVLSGNKDLTKILRMKKSRTVVVKTADEDLRWLQYHIFQKREVSSGQLSRTN